jgi:hypothetical protein
VSWADDDDRELAARRQAALPRSRLLEGPAVGTRAHPVFVPANPPAVGATRAFQLSMAGIGWQLYSTTRTHADDAEPEFRSRRGGVCVDVIHDRAVTDDGEVIESTRYRCVELYHGQPRWVMLDAGEVDLDQLGGLDRRACWSAWRWLLRDFVNSRRQPGVADMDRIGCAMRLARAATL